MTHRSRRQLLPHSHFAKANGSPVSKTIKYYEDLLREENFFRVHKSHIINLNYMKKFVKGEGGYVVMNDEKEILVSRRRRTPFMDRMRNLGGERTWIRKCEKTSVTNRWPASCM